MRRRFLFVVAALALLVVSIGGAKPLTGEPLRVDHTRSVLSATHVATGLTAMRHKTDGNPRSLIRALAALQQSLLIATGLAAGLLTLATLVVVRRHQRFAIALRAPPFSQI